VLGPSDVEDEDMVFCRNVWTRSVTQRNIPKYLNCYAAYPVQRLKFLILSKEIVSVCSENSAKRINTLW